MRRLFWDFGGGQAAGTAAHFKRHLDEFLTREGIEGCETGTEEYSRFQHAAWCEAPNDAAEILIKSLRPRRATDPTPDGA